MKLDFLRQAALCLLATCAATGHAETFPTRAITVVVPFAAGGNNDVAGRVIAQQMSESLGQPVVVENRTGAAGAIGATFVARAKADGYTLGFMSSGPMATNVSLYKALPYDPAKDFVTVARTTTSPNVLVVHPSVQANNLAELVTWLKEHPRKMNYGTSGNGSSPHLAAVLFESRAGVEMTGVPYRGGNQVNSDLLAGQIQASFSPILEVLPHIQAGKLKALGVTSAKRSALLPDVPAIAEQFPGYEILNWNGIVAPAGTPAEVIARLSTETVKAVNSPGVKAKLLQLGLEPAPSTAAEFGAFVKSEITAFAKLVKLAGVEPQ